MAKDISVAPKERVNITYEANTNGVKEQVELPNKMLVIGDFTQREDHDRVVEREVLNVDKANFNDVMAQQNLSTTFQVTNKLSSDEGDEFNVSLEFKNMKDFEPEQVVNQVPNLKKLLELRDALTFLKGPLGNVPAFKKQIDNLLNDEAKREALMSELGIDKE